MAKPVLGNDPFVRGAAPSAPASKLSAKPVAATARAPRKASPPPAAAPPDTHRPETSRAREAPPVVSSPWTLARDVIRGAVETARWLPGAAILDGAWAIAQVALGLPSGAQLDAYGQDGALIARLGAWRDLFYTRYFRVAVAGADRIPAGAVLLVANHAGTLPLDGWLLTEAVRRERRDLGEARWLLEDAFYTAPFVGTLSNRLGALRASPENAERLLAEGRPVAVFPEGMQGVGKPFSERYTLQRFGRGGFVKLAVRLGVPIVPVGIVGSEETLPLLGKLPVPLGEFPFVPLHPAGLLPLPAKWRIHFGAPLDLEGVDRDAQLDPATVDRLTESTREAIRSLLRDALQERGAAF